jgi:AcrR family transcriptional regulator
MDQIDLTTKFGFLVAETAHEPDGRKDRSKQSQQRIVNAMLALVAEGNMEPSADQIAVAARVGRRSVFRHFEDMDTLYREMTDRLEATMGSVILRKFEAPDWWGKVLELVDRRAGAFEALMPFMRAGQVHRHRSPFLKESHARFVGLLRQILLGVLPADEARDPAMVEAIDLLLSFESWNRLREDQRLDIDTAKNVLKQAVAPLLERASG